MLTAWFGLATGAATVAVVYLFAVHSYILAALAGLVVLVTGLRLVHRYGRCRSRGSVREIHCYPDSSMVTVVLDGAEIRSGAVQLYWLTARLVVLKPDGLPAPVLLCEDNCDPRALRRVRAMLVVGGGMAA